MGQPVKRTSANKQFGVPTCRAFAQNSGAVFEGPVVHIDYEKLMNLVKEQRSLQPCKLNLTKCFV